MKEKMKENWQKFGSSFSVIMMWCGILFSDMVFGIIYGQAFMSLIVGISSLLFLTIKDPAWFGIEKFREYTFLTLGIVNLIASAVGFYIIQYGV